MPRAKTRAKDKPIVVNAIEASYCHQRLQGKTPAEAGEACGIGVQQGLAYEQRVGVRAWMERYTEQFIAGMAQADVMKATKNNISRESILLRLWHLGNTPPQETRGSIDGQVTALMKLADLLGIAFDPNKLPEQFRNWSDEELRKYAATGKPQ